MRTGRLAKLLQQAAFFLEPVWLIAAHADDETIGLGGHLRRFKHLRLIHVTNSRPPDVFFAKRSGVETLAEYQRVRAAEVKKLCETIELPESNYINLGIDDQRAVLSVDVIVSRLIEIYEVLPVSQRPRWLITHPYEGGHPDHDALAYAVARAAEKIEDTSHLEMLSYHADNTQTDGIVTDRFLEETTPCWSATLNDMQMKQKTRLLTLFTSQREILSLFQHRIEKIRLAPLYDFSRPPHEGPLYYEGLGWPSTCITTWQQWHRLLTRADPDI